MYTKAIKHGLREMESREGTCVLEFHSNKMTIGHNTRGEVALWVCAGNSYFETWVYQKWKDVLEAR